MKFCFTRKDFIDQEINGEKLAVIAENHELSWKEFETKVNDVCNYFIQNNWDQLKYPVIIYGHKQAEMIVAIYAMMKLEIPYIPADIIYPNERIDAIKTISKADVFINCSGKEVSFSDITIVSYSNFNLASKNDRPAQLTQTKPIDPLVYLIFTSGSTGEPKGVQISTEAIQDFTQWMCEDFGFTASDVFVNIAVLSFDLSVYELMSFGALGASLLLNSKESTEDPEILLNRIEKYKGTIWVSTPSFAFIYSRLDEIQRLDSLRYFLFCGELLPHGLAKTLVNKYPNAIVYNTYGPTEATVATTLIQIDDEILENHPILPVGKSKPRSKLLIENDEIIIIGKNVSKGYLNRPDLNEEKFVVIDNERAFKTGDLGYLENGILFFKGRNDDQVKLHGFRIELHEITSQLNKLDFILQAETIPLKRNNEVKKIVSLVQLKSTLNKETDWKKMILDELSKKLPYYMIPSDIKFVDSIPLNQNGKADKKTLESIYLRKG